MNRRTQSPQALAPAILRGARNAARPNIIYLTRTTGRYIQPTATPSHAESAKVRSESVLFRQAFDAAPTCSAVTGALLTGMAPRPCGMFGLATEVCLNDPKQHLAIS